MSKKRQPERPRDVAELDRLVVEPAADQRPNDSFEESDPPEPGGRARGGFARAAVMTPGALPRDRQEGCGPPLGRCE